MSAAQDRSGTSAVGAAPRFRVWPPLAVAVPWTAGYLAESWLGGPDVAAFDHAVTRVLGAVLVVGFAAWNGWCLVLFRRHRTGLLPGQSTTVLLERGPYRLSRNPLYVGLLVLYVGLSLLCGLWMPLPLVVVAWAGLQWGAVLPEERYLHEVVGPEYDAYCARVRRWL